MDIEKIDEICNALTSVQKSFDRYKSVMGGGPSEYYFKRLKDYYQGCMAASKFKVGDQVKLVEDVDTSGAPGWEGCKHFLIKGAKATIKHVDYMDGRYRYDIEFDVETYLSNYDVNTHTILKEKKALPVTNKHTFAFGEKHLKKVKTK